MSKKRVMLQCPCFLSRIGIEALFSRQHSFFELVVSEPSLTQYEDLLSCDVIMLNLDDYEYNLFLLLKLIVADIPHSHPKIIIAEAPQVAVINKVLGGLRGIYTVVDRSSSLEIFREQIIAALQGCLQTAKVNIRKVDVTALSPQEILILYRILNGDEMMKIAKDLLINYKMVSYYKRSALSKLGMRSITSFFCRDNNKKVEGCLSHD